MHQSVLLEEAMSGLSIIPEGIYVDATFGRGGHSKAILSKLSAQGRLLVIDQDPEAIDLATHEYSQDERVIIRHGSFTHLQKWVQALDWDGRVNGILLDLGVSSPQLDDATRGFSFQRTGPLDMRMDPTQSLDAATWLARTPENEIARVLYEYGEERFSRRIARAIVAARQVAPIVTTTALAEVIAKAVPFSQPGKHPATRSFQAIRIAVNRELEALTAVLKQSLEILTVMGRLVVISFHSLEDHIVKDFIQYWAKGGLPPDLAIPEAHVQRRLRMVGKMIRPSASEVKFNPRARSARCRIVEKLK